LTFERPLRILEVLEAGPSKTIIIPNRVSNHIPTSVRHMRPRYQRSSGSIFGKIAAAGLALAVIVAAIAWGSFYFFTTRKAFQGHQNGQPQETLVFEYTVTHEVDRIRVRGTAGLPNGVILIGTLDRVGSGPIEVKEALVMNRLFAIEFGPELYVQYYLHGPQRGLQAGVYRVNIELDPSQQSPFVKDSLHRSSLMNASAMRGNDPPEIASATFRLSKIFTIGTAAEQQETQTREQHYRETIRQHLHDTLGKLTGFWPRLHAQFQQERLTGGFSRTDPRASDWQTWSAQWLQDLTDLGAEARLDEMVSPASPYSTAQHALVNLHKQLILMPDFYFEVLINDRSLTDHDLQRAEHVLQSALGDAIAQLGEPDGVPSPLKVERVKPTVIVTLPVVNVRNGPGMNHESITQLKKDDVLDLLAERGEWLQVQLSAGRTGWVHRNVTSKRPQGDGTADNIKPVDVKPSTLERRPHLRLEPIMLLSTPVAFIPRPTSDEMKIYVELEQQLRDVRVDHAEERKVAEQRICQRLSDKYSISPEQVWNAYLKVQGWEIKP
jgi:Bacterial SH3 domain